MTVNASITVSVDGYVAGPDDGPAAGLGIGGERLHYWVFGGPWSYDDQEFTEATGEDKAFLDDVMARLGASVCGRWMYEAAGHWGDQNPWGVPTFVVTHRPEEEPEGGAFTFVDGVEKAVALAVEAAGDKDVSIAGGADVIRQALAAGRSTSSRSSRHRCCSAAGSGSSTASPRTSSSSTSTSASHRSRRSSRTASSARPTASGCPRGVCRAEVRAAMTEARCHVLAARHRPPTRRLS